MNKLVIALGAATVALAASTVYFAWQLGVERERPLAEQTSDASRSPLAGGASHTESDTTAANNPEKSAASGDSSPGLLSRLGAAVLGNGSKRAPRELVAKLGEEQFLRMMGSPATRRELIEEAVPNLRDQFLALERRLNPGATRWQQFLETMAEFEIEGRSAMIGCKRDVQCAIRSQSGDVELRRKQALRDVLGDVNYEVFTNFAFSVPERRAAEALQSRLPDQQRLSDLTLEQFIDAISEVRRDSVSNGSADTSGGTRLLTSEGGVLAMPASLNTAQEQLDFATAYSERLSARAATLLNALQLEAFNDMQQRQLNALRRKAEQERKAKG